MTEFPWGRAAAVFLATYFLAYFAFAWLHPNVPASFRAMTWFEKPVNPLLGLCPWRFILALAATLTYALWITA